MCCQHVIYDGLKASPVGDAGHWIREGFLFELTFSGQNLGDVFSAAGVLEVMVRSRRSLHAKPNDSSLFVSIDLHVDDALSTRTEFVGDNLDEEAASEGFDIAEIGERLEVTLEQFVES